MARRTLTQKQFNDLQSEWYGRLKDEGFDDIESGLDSPPLLKPHHRPMNAAIGKSFVTAEGDGRGREWEELLSDGGRWVDTFSSGRARYYLMARTIASQEYALRRLGTGTLAVRKRAAWAMHAVGTPMRDIARFLGVGLWVVDRTYIKEFRELILSALDAEG